MRLYFSFVVRVWMRVTRRVEVWRRRNMPRLVWLRAVCVGFLVSISLSTARADDWDIYITVDNQFDVYFGSSTATDFYAGSGTSWPTEYHFTATGRPPTDYLYVATASDQSVAQGFISSFTNTTIGKTISTGNVDPNTGMQVWEVFDAGAYAATNPYYPSPWPPSLLPTQAQVDAAISYANSFGLWHAPTGATGYDNDTSTSTAPYTYPWTYYPNIETKAKWIWHDSGSDPGSAFMPAPLNGFNHDEFLVFRVIGKVPEPSTLIGLGTIGLVALLRRR
jgi:hypothetical protein